MNAEEFVAKLESIRPSEVDLASKGLSECEIQSFLKYFTATKKVDSINLGSRDPLIELVRDFDATGLAVGLVTFLPECLEKEGKVFVGRVDADDLVVDKTMGTVEVFQYDCQSFLIWECGINSGHFLDALIEFGSDVLAPNRDMDIDVASADRCAQLAGGVKYREFWLMLYGLGTLDDGTIVG